MINSMLLLLENFSIKSISCYKM